MDTLLWPDYAGPADLARVEAVPLPERGLPATTYELVVRAATLWPERPALSVLRDAGRWEDPEERTYSALLGDVHRFANVLFSLGVRRTDAVALLAPNCDELITATLAAQLAGIATPMNSALSQEHLAELLQRSGTRVLVAAGPDLAPDVWATARELAAETGVTALVALGATGSDQPAVAPVEGIHTARLAELAEAQPGDVFLGEPPAASDLASLFHTGGTTGTPKLAAHTHGNEVSDAWMIALSPLMREGGVVFAALPLFHVNALHVTLLGPLFRGLQAVWAGPLGYRDPALFTHFWKIVERYRVTTMSAVPTVYSVLAGCPVDADISTLRNAVVGASPLPEAVRQGFEAATGIHLVEGYGLTEATCASVLSFPRHSRAGAVGQRMPYQQMKAVEIGQDGEWSDLPAGRVGVLVISGPTVFPGYVTGRGPRGPVVDGLGKLRDGWLDTGDLAVVDADGFVSLRGRAKDLIIRGGHNIDPAVVEQALLDHPEVAAAQAVGRPDAHAGEVPVAFVTLTSGAGVSPAELCAWAAFRVPERAAAPKAVTVVDALPLTHVGKPFKPPLRAEAARQAVTEALRDLPGITGVRGVVEDGTVVTVVVVSDEVDEPALKETLNRFAITWRLEKS
jgi:acyl-CoA synthetase (AMP-forming)/AMP-acid ligase II